MNSGPIHFLRLRNNGKAFPSLDGMTFSYSTLTSFSFYQDSGYLRGIGFLETLLLLGIIIRTAKLLGIKVLVLL